MKVTPILPERVELYKRDTSTADSVDNDLQVFEISHNVITDDQVFHTKSTLKELKVIVNAADDDTAKIMVESKQIMLKEGGDPETILITGLASEPIFDVNVTIETPSLIQASSAVIKKEEWNNFTKVIYLQALNGATPGSAVIRLQPHSLDPKYNDTALGISMDVTVLRATIPAVLVIPLLQRSMRVIHSPTK